jgi:hypothetical protein
MERVEDKNGKRLEVKGDRVYRLAVSRAFGNRWI